MNTTDDLITLDPLSAAEELTGRSYKTDELDRYVRIITELGFEQVLDVPFDAPGYHEHFFVYARRDGLLLAFDTF